MFQNQWHIYHPNSRRSQIAKASVVREVFDTMEHPWLAHVDETSFPTAGPSATRHILSNQLLHWRANAPVQVQRDGATKVVKELPSTNDDSAFRIFTIVTLAFPMWWSESHQRRASDGQDPSTVHANILVQACASAFLVIHQITNFHTWTSKEDHLGTISLLDLILWVVRIFLFQFMGASIHDSCHLP